MSIIVFEKGEFQNATDLPMVYSSDCTVLLLTGEGETLRNTMMIELGNQIIALHMDMQLFRPMKKLHLYSKPTFQA